MKKLSDKEEKPNPYADLDQKQIYERLNILDSKTGGVLSVSSTVIAISLIPATINELNGVEETLM